MAEQHSSKGIMWATIVVAIVLIAIIYPLTNKQFGPAADYNSSSDAADVRIQPVAHFELAKAAAANAAPMDGPTIFKTVCSSCHGTGALGAPKAGDKTAWAPRLAQGMDALYHNALNGKGNMPPRGGTTLSDDEIKGAVDYLAGLAK